MINEKPYLQSLVTAWAARGSNRFGPDGTPVAAAAEGPMADGASSPAALLPLNDLKSLKALQLKFIADEISSITIATMAGLLTHRQIPEHYLYVKALLMWAIALDARVALEQAVQGANTLSQSAESTEGLESILLLFQNVASEMIRGTSQASVLQAIDDQRAATVHRGTTLDTALLQYALTGTQENLVALLHLANA